MNSLKGILEVSELYQEEKMTELLKSYNPADGSLVGEVEITPIENIAEIVDRSKAAQKKWAELSIDERIEILQRAGQSLYNEVRDIGLLLSKEMGKSLDRALGEVGGSARSISYVVQNVKEAIKPVIKGGYGMETVVKYDPIGVCCIIAPWNYPVSMAHWMMIPALTAGNSVILKPSEETPLVAKAYVEALNKELPENLLQIVFGDETQGKALVKSEVNFIGFTGSMDAGKQIMREASDTMKRLIMELGGKDPLIVLEDADVDEAVSFGVANALENAGQMCISTERIFVHESIADEFEKKAAEYTTYFRIGPYTDKNAQIGPIINDSQRNRILEQIDDALSKGARLIAGGAGEYHPEHFIIPTVLADVTEEMTVYKEETFGPIVCITRFSDLEEAIRMANNTEYGLGAVVYGHKEADYVASKLDAGMIGINCGSGGGGDTPWVGAKMSGFGYHGSADGHRQFTQARVVNRVVAKE